MHDNNLTYIEASCHCELNCFAVGFETAKLPISTDLCHCNTCRHSSGQLAVEQVGFKGVPMKSAHPGTRRRARSANGSRSRSPSPSPLGRKADSTNKTVTQGGLLAVPTVLASAEQRQPFELNDIIAYKSSEKAIRYFCRSCGAHLFFVSTVNGQDRWSVAVGALDDIQGIVQVGYHIWVGDTLDGGLADHLPSINGVELPRYKEDEDSPQLPIGWSGEFTSNAIADTRNPEQLFAYCHCRTIQLALSRPSAESSNPTRAYADLLYPYDVTHLSKINNPNDEKWWLRANDTKYLAGHCMCSSCRLTSGFDIQSWGFVPLYNMVNAETGETLCLTKEESRPKGLKRYMSSPGKCREFCGTCGASVFWWDAGAPDLIDVSMGLFDEKIAGGARAEGWFEWCRSRVSFDEKAQNQELAKALLQGLKGTKHAKS